MCGHGRTFRRRFAMGEAVNSGKGKKILSTFHKASGLSRDQSVLALAITSLVWHGTTRLACRQDR